MNNIKLYHYLIPLGLSLAVVSCKAPAVAPTPASAPIPEAYVTSKDTANIASTPWKTFFKDKNLTDLIDVALKNNQELLLRCKKLRLLKAKSACAKGLFYQRLALALEQM